METPQLTRRPRRTLFITGTDTGVGKTTAACALLKLARGEGIDACGWKPVATGCERTPDGLRNADALALQAAAGTGLPYEDLNPYAFAPPIAPHLAARTAGRAIRTAELDRVHAELAKKHELVVAEGAGGWMVPLNDTWTTASWVAEREWPVLLVVGLRLGCLNHALLSMESIRRHTPVAGWLANVLPPAMERWEENLETLKHRISAPFWGVIGPGGDPRLTDAVLEFLRRVPAPASED